jgi:lipopolysaccharide export system permease protein
VIGSTLNRMIFWELVRVFLLSLGTLTGLFLIVGLIQQASQLGLTLTQILRAIPLFVPSTLPLTIPATTLFASCVVYGRLAHDNEVIALKAAGVHLFGIIKPGLLLGALATLATASLYHTIIPLSQQRLYEQILSDPEEVLYNQLRRDRCLRHPSLPYVLYVRDVQGKRLIDVVIKRRAKVKDLKTGAELSTVGYDLVARMHEAQLRVDLAAGKVTIDPDRFVVYEKNASGSTGSAGGFTMDLPDSVSGKEAKLRISALTWDDLPSRIATLADEREELVRQRAKLQVEVDNLPNPAFRALAQAEVKNSQFLVDAKTRQVRNLQAEQHARPALAVSCLVFALIGCPVGIWANRADYLSTFVICFLPTLVVYYPLLLAGSDMGKRGRVPLGLGCWAADIIVGCFGLFLTWRLLRR